MSEFHVTNRAQLLNDAYEHVTKGYISYETVMYLLRIVEHEDEYITWNAARYILGTVTNSFFGHQSYALWEVSDFLKSNLVFFASISQDISVQNLLICCSVSYMDVFLGFPSEPH